MKKSLKNVFSAAIAVNYESLKNEACEILKNVEVKKEIEASIVTEEFVAGLIKKWSDFSKIKNASELAFCAFKQAIKEKKAAQESAYVERHKVDYLCALAALMHNESIIQKRIIQLATAVAKEKSTEEKEVTTEDIWREVGEFMAKKEEK